MNFRITFKNQLGKPIVDYENIHIGLDLIDLTRERIFDENKDVILNKELPLELFESSISCPSFVNQANLILTENQARESNKFNANSVFIVYIKTAALGRYTSIDHILYKEYHKEEPVRSFIDKFLGTNKSYIRTDTFYVRSIHFVYKLDEERIIKDWIKDGCPQYWNCEKMIGLSIDKPCDSDSLNF